MAPDAVSSPAFRYEPPALASDLVRRSELLDLVAGRFERRLTVIVAGAGFGKTTLMAQATMTGKAAGTGMDAWLRVGVDDRDPAHLVNGLVRSVTGVDRGSACGLDDLVDAVRAVAPRPVALVLDDAHHLGDEELAWRPLDALLDVLPANGHLVIVGRAMPALPVRRLQADGRALVIDGRAMSFSEADLDAFARVRDLPPPLRKELPTWPALAVLTATVGRRASVDHLRSEVVAGLDPERRALMARAALFDVVDDDLLAVLAPGRPNASRLVDGLPLVDVDRLGSLRLHPLWGAALVGVLDDAQRREALVAGATSLLERGRYGAAVDAFADADDLDGLELAVRRFASQPIARVDAADISALLARLPRELRTGPVGTYLEAATHWATSPSDARAQFGLAAEVARLDGDLELEALARWRGVQLDHLDDHARLVPDDRSNRLASEGVPLGAATSAFVRSIEAQRDGRIGDALALLDELDGLPADQRQVTLTSRLIDLGRPEAVRSTLDSILGPDAIDAFGAQALWFRGEVDPETGWMLASSLAGVAGRKGIVHEQVSITCVVATIALAAGAADDAARLIDDARASVDVVGTQVRLMVEVASALLALSVDGEEAARAGLEGALALVPLGRWPARAYLHALTALRALVPDAQTLDELDLGPSLRVAVDAGRAVVEQRAGNSDATRALPWGSPSLLRAHVPPPLLAELALGRALEVGPGADLALDLLDRLPGRGGMERLAGRGSEPVAVAAAAVLARRPERPSFDLHIDALGPLELRRSDGVEVDRGWMSRGRVLQLLVRLLLVRTINRHALAAEVWPDLPTDRAAANLRVNLRHLQRVLQPHRPTGSSFWFLRADGGTLQLASSGDGLEIDIDRFDELVAAALRAESEGMPSVALVEYRGALARYRGDLLSGVDDPALDMERIRLRSVAHAAHCRCGELSLARGDAHTAIEDAVQALAVDPISERAHRLLVRSHLVLGSSAAARSAAAHLVATLDRHRLRPDDESRLLLARLET